MQIAWTRPDTTSTYIVELGSAAGLSDVGTVDTGDNGDFETLTNVRVGTTFARVRGKSSAGLSEPSNEVSFRLIELRDFIEALFLGSGPLVSIDSGPPTSNPHACPAANMWAGFRRGTTVRVRVSDRIDPSRRENLRAMASQIADATHGAVTATFETTTEELPVARDGQNVHAVVPASSPMRQYCGTDDTIACVRYVPFPIVDGIIRASSAFYRDGSLHGPSPFVHEMGHGILGMCHIDDQQLGVNASVINGFIGLSPLDFYALRAVYGSSLSPGARRADFVAAGLVNP